MSEKSAARCLHQTEDSSLHIRYHSSRTGVPVALQHHRLKSSSKESGRFIRTSTPLTGVFFWLIRGSSIASIDTFCPGYHLQASPVLHGSFFRIGNNQESCTVYGNLRMNTHLCFYTQFPKLVPGRTFPK
jgi:hypothetical protein